MTILNDQVYNAALSGSFSGMTYGNRSPTSGVQADYATESAVAEAFAAAVDAAWASPVGISDAEEDMLQSACEQFWGSRWTRDPNMAPLAPYIAAIIAGVKSASTGLRSGNSAILATLADLAALPSAALADGTSCRVLTVRDVFVLAKVSALAADGITVIDASGGGQWIRQDWTDPSWAAQATWYVDTGAGNDESSGIDQVHALKTGAELSRRLSGALVQRRIDIYWSGDQAASDSLLLDLRRTKAGTIYFHGTPVTVFTSSAGGFTGVSNQNLAASTWGYVADTGLPDTWAAQGWINTLHRVRVTTGANAGAIAWPNLDTNDASPKSAQTSSWIKYDANVLPITASPVQINVAVGDQYVIEKLPSIPRFAMYVQIADDFTVNTNAIGVIIDSVSFAPGSGPYGSLRPQLTAFNDEWVLYGCANVDLGVSSGTLYAIGCDSPGFATDNAGSGVWVILSACNMRSRFTVNGGCMAYVQNATIVQGSSLARVRQGGYLAITDAGSFASPSDGLLVEADGQVRIQGYLVGSGNAGFGINSSGKTSIATLSKVTVTGASGDFKCGGDTSVPPWNPATPGYVAATTTTWAHLAAAVGAGTGFGGNCFNPKNGAFVGQYV